MMLRSKRPTETAEDYLIHKLRESISSLRSLRVETCTVGGCRVCEDTRVVWKQADLLLEETEDYK